MAAASAEGSCTGHDGDAITNSQPKPATTADEPSHPHDHDVSLEYQAALVYPEACRVMDRGHGDPTITCSYGMQMPRNLVINISEASGYKVMALRRIRKIVRIEGNCMHAHQPLRKAKKTVSKIGKRQ
jgi:hypothetical protein